MSDNAKERRSGVDRRDCMEQCEFAHLAKRSVPRVYFLSSLSTMVIIALSFAGWHVASLKTFKTESEAGLTHLKIELQTILKTQELHVSERLTDARLSYNQDVERFIRATMENRKVLTGLTTGLNDVNVRLGRAEAKQDLVLEKIGLSKHD